MKAFDTYNFSKERLEQAEQLFNENEKIVYFCMQKFAGVGKKNDEDLRQDCKLTLWKACLTYDGEIGKFSTYAVNCIRNQIVRQTKYQNRMKRRETQSTLSIENSVWVESKPSGDSNLTFSELIADRSHETINLFGKYEDIFTPRQMQIFNYRLKGLTLAEIGKELSISHTMVGYELRKMQQKWEDNHINFGGVEY